MSFSDCPQKGAYHFDNPQPPRPGFPNHAEDSGSEICGSGGIAGRREAQKVTEIGNLIVAALHPHRSCLKFQSSSVYWLGSPEEVYSRLSL